MSSRRSSLSDSSVSRCRLTLSNRSRKEVVQPLMPSLEFAHHVGQQRRDLLVADRHHAGDDLEDAFLIVRLEGPKENARVIRLENDASTLDVHVERSSCMGKQNHYHWESSNRLRLLDDFGI